MNLSSCQLLIIITEDWSSSTGKLFLCEREDQTQGWSVSAGQLDVSLGKNGLAWGRGIHHPVEDEEKKEGDEKSPAGIFPLLSLFGFSHEREMSHLQMPYFQIQDSTEAIDDPSSRYYNRIVDREKIIFPDWNSSEKMKEIELYELGIVIGHNISAIPHKGSAIFFHLWRGEGMPTEGCSATSYENMKKIFAFLSMHKKPHLVQLPQEEYKNLQNKFLLPEIPFSEIV